MLTLNSIIMYCYCERIYDLRLNCYYLKSKIKSMDFDSILTVKYMVKMVFESGRLLV